MGIINWIDDFSVNNTEIDDQHKKWIKLYNNAHNQMMGQKLNEPFDISKDALKEMIKYGEYHFSFEEKLMENIGFPDIEKHKEIHRNFVRKLDEIALQIHQEGNVLNSQLVKTIKNWLVDHILEEDQKYKEYIKS